MRCKNCGWENPDNQAKCEKCSAPMSVSIAAEDMSPPAGKIDPKVTAKGCPACGYPIRKVEKTCPHCSHEFVRENQVIQSDEEIAPIKERQTAPKQMPEKQIQIVMVEKPCPFCKISVPDTAQFCSNCGASLSNERKTLGTIKPWAGVEQKQAPGCSLTFVTGDNEPSDATLRYTGHLIQLNRSNTDPSNQTITSKTQAELSFEDGKWYLLDKSEFKSTYIYAGYKIELKQDDVIVLGNRPFRFGYVSENKPK